MKCPYQDPTPEQCFNCPLPECGNTSTAEKQRDNYYRNIDKKRAYHRNYQRKIYDTAVNTEKCRKYRESHLKEKREYDRERYLKRKSGELIGVK